ncbi:hypothetical protein GCM10010298_71950 [Streptomyces microflavus]|uniref:Uncharacterized protein n=1 Tax=Streptomyces microflavus TaxID=1919 RepID=A0A7J0CKF3_STRMI|nr:hypothetical protein Smic_15120 [Streptomyces microflavus]GGX96139.1 hypothetical protein GCM10010298_71950 [Streptomyces microflavus]
MELGVVTGDLEVGDDQLVLQRTADAHDPAERQLVERGRAAVAVDRRRPRGAAVDRSAAVGRGGRLRRALLVGNLLVRGLLLGLRRLLLPRLLGRGLVLRGLVLAVVHRRLVLGGCLLSGPGGARLRMLLLRLLLLLLLLLLLHGSLAGGGGEIQPRAVGGVAQAYAGAGPDLRPLDPLPLHIRAVGGAVVLDEPTPATPADRGVPPRDSGVVDRQVPLRVTPQGVRPGRIERPGAAIQFQYEFRHSAPHLLSPDFPPSQGV